MRITVLYSIVPNVGRALQIFHAANILQLSAIN